MCVSLKGAAHLRLSRTTITLEETLYSPSINKHSYMCSHAPTHSHFVFLRDTQCIYSQLLAHKKSTIYFTVIFTVKQGTFLPFKC